jgi:hypothetical protein
VHRALTGTAAAAAILVGGSAPALAQDCCAIFAPSPIPPLSRSQVVSVPVTVTNTGEPTWLGGGQTGWVLSYLIFNGSGGLARIGPATLFPKDVHKGETVTVTVLLRAPQNLGTYTVSWFIGTDQVRHDSTYYYGSTTFPQPIVVDRPLLQYSALQSWLARSKGTPEDPASAWHLPSIESVAGRSATEVTTFTTVGGRNFDGSAIGKLNLTLADGSVFSPYPTYWTDTQASVMFDVSGKLDQPATLQIVTVGGATSNEWPVMFRAGQQDKFFPPELVQVHCATAGGTTDSCGPQRESPSMFLVGFHESDCCYNGDSGTDTYTLPPLLNDWNYTAILFSARGDGTALRPSEFTKGPQGQTLTVAWSTPLHRSVTYSIMIRIEGPNGVPFH